MNLSGGTDQGAERSAAASILRLAWTQRGRLLGGLACMAVVAAATALYALLLGPTLESLFAPGAPPQMVQRAASHLPWLAELLAADPGALRWGLPLMILAAAGVKGAAWFGQRHLMARAGERVAEQLRTRAYRALLGAQLLELQTLRSGDLTSRLVRDADQVREAVTEGVTALGRDGLSALLLFGVAVGLDAGLSLIAFVAFPVAAGALVWFGRRLRRVHQDSDALRGQLGAHAAEALANAEAIKADGAESREASTFASLASALAGRQSRALSLRAAHHAVAEFVGVGGLALTLLYALSRVNAGTLSADVFVSFFAALVMLYEPLRSLSKVNAMMQAGASGLSRVQALTKLPPETDGEVELETGAAATIAARGLGLSYEAGRPVFEGLSFDVEPGDVLSIVGDSGAGKSSLARMLMGMIAPTSGTLHVGGHPIEALRRSSLRADVAYAGQDVMIFDGDVASNVRYANPDASEAELQRALEDALVDEFAAELPQGLKTPLGERGLRLSGGQRQRLAVARALLKPASVLILDEALTGLEPQARRRVLERLVERRRGGALI